MRRSGFRRASLSTATEPCGESRTCPVGVRDDAVMGYNTNIIGHIEVQPPLSVVEQRYLTAFGQVRHIERPGGPYEVDPNPAASRGRDPALSTEAYNAIASGKPNYWCDWAPCWEGCCLVHSGKEKSYSMRDWLEYLIEHFLRPGAKGEASGSHWLEGFSFDHVLNGIVACCRNDTRELWLIRLEDNEVQEEVLRRGDPEPWM